MQPSRRHPLLEINACQHEYSTSSVPNIAVQTAPCTVPHMSARAQHEYQQHKVNVQCAGVIKWNCISIYCLLIKGVLFCVGLLVCSYRVEVSSGGPGICGGLHTIAVNLPLIAAAAKASGSSKFMTAALKSTPATYPFRTTIKISSAVINNARVSISQRAACRLERQTKDRHVSVQITLNICLYQRAREDTQGRTSVAVERSCHNSLLVHLLPAFATATPTTSESLAQNLTNVARPFVR